MDLPARTAELEQSRQLLYELLMKAPCPIAVFRGRELIFELANERLKRAAGREVAGKPLLTAIPELAGQGFEQLIGRVLETGELYVGECVPVKLLRGGELKESFWSFSYAPLRTSDGAVDRVMLIAFEVTEQELARRERERNVAELQRTVQLSEMLMSVLGHDLRTPLASVIATARGLARSEAGGRISEPLARMVESATRMNRMIDQLLDFSRVRLGHGLPLYRQTLDAERLCATILGELEAVYGDRELRLVAQGSLLGRFDRDRLSQLFTNLGANACQHADRGPVLFEADGRDESQIVVRVRSPGALPSELLPVLFEPFRAGVRSASGSSPQGLGLGLYISRQIALAHGGELTVETSAEQGTTFVVRLPRW